MKIELPWIKPFDTLDLPDDFEDQVKESFRKYTMGTSTRYTWKDKMLYIIHLPLIFKGTIDLPEDTIAEKEVRDLIHRELDYKLDEADDVLDRDDIYSFEFMCQCFVDGMRYVGPFHEYESYSSSKNEETEKVMFRIVQIVMSWEPEETNDETD